MYACPSCYAWQSCEISTKNTGLTSIQIYSIYILTRVLLTLEQAFPKKKYLRSLQTCQATEHFLYFYICFISLLYNPILTASNNQSSTLYLPKILLNSGLSTSANTFSKPTILHSCFSMTYKRGKTLVCTCPAWHKASMHFWHFAQYICGTFSICQAHSQTSKKPLHISVFILVRLSFYIGETVTVFFYSLGRDASCKHIKQIALPLHRLISSVVKVQPFL